MKTTLTAAMVVLLVGAAAVAVFGGEREDAAVEVAAAWLELVDAGNFEASWDEAASLFQKAVTQTQWSASLNAVRKPLGGVVSRKLKRTQFVTELPGAPDGEYVVIQFDTSFDNKARAVETVTPMKDDDGVWRVSGYYIK